MIIAELANGLRLRCGAPKEPITPSPEQGKALNTCNAATCGNGMIRGKLRP